MSQSCVTHLSCSLPVSWLSTNVTTDVPGRLLPPLSRTMPAWLSQRMSHVASPLAIDVRVDLRGKSNPSASAPRAASAFTHDLMRDPLPQYSPTTKRWLPL